MAMPWRICGKVIVGGHFFSPLGFLHEKPHGQERKRLMLLPPRPMAPLIVRQPRFALASLETFFDAMCGCGHPGQLPQRRLRRRIGQRIIHLHHFLLVTVAGADDHQHLLIAWLTPMGFRHPTSFDGLHHQRTFTAIAHVDPLPGVLTQRLTPGLNAVPGTLAWASSTTTPGQGAVARSRSAVFDGTAHRYRSPSAASRRRNQYGRPISSSPAIQLGGSPPPCVVNISKANW